jgi:hypothetical protein
MKNVSTYADGLVFCADGIIYADGFFSYADICLARRPCA